MGETIASIILATFKAGSRIYGAVFLAASATIFLPTSVTDKIGLTEFRGDHRTELGLAFLCSGSLLLMHAILIVGNFLARPIYRRRFVRDIRETLSNLTYEEKLFLRPYIHEGENTNVASYSDGIANGLVAKKVVYRASNASIPGTIMEFPFNLQPYVRKELMKHPGLLD